IGISKLLSVATSYCPAWLENSWLILSRTSFSGSTVKFTAIPVSAVKCSSVSCCRSTICGLLTISTLMVFGPPPVGPPPQPAHPPTPTASAVARVTASAGCTRLRTIGSSRGRSRPDPCSYERDAPQMCVASLTCALDHVKGCNTEKPCAHLSRRRHDTTADRTRPGRPHGVRRPALLPRRPLQDRDRGGVRPEPVQGRPAAGRRPRER